MINKENNHGFFFKTTLCIRRLSIRSTRKLIYEIHCVWIFKSTWFLSYCSRMYNIIWERCIHRMRRQHCWYGHKLYENYCVFCNQFEVINFIPLANVTICNMNAANIFSFIHTGEREVTLLNKRDSSQRYCRIKLLEIKLTN